MRRHVYKVSENELQKGTKYVTVRLLTLETLYFVVEPRAARVADLFNLVCDYYNLRDPEFVRLFGLAVATDDREYLFLEPDDKLKKYASKEWRMQTSTGDDKTGKSLFSVYLRIKFYVDSYLFISDKFTRHQYYLQLRENVVNYGQALSEERSFLLASYALQADLGNYNSDKHVGRYFDPHLYFPSWVIDRMGSDYIVQHAPTLHRDLVGLAAADAQSLYIKEASDPLAPHNCHLYRMRPKKGDADVWLAIRTDGIEIYQTPPSARLKASQSATVATLPPEKTSTLSLQPRKAVSRWTSTISMAMRTSTTSTMSTTTATGATTASDSVKLKTSLSFFAWQDIDKIDFDKKRFELRSVRSERRFTYFANSVELARNLFQLCTFGHLFQQSLLLQPRMIDAKTREEVLSRKRFRESYVDNNRHSQATLSNGINGGLRFNSRNQNATASASTESSATSSTNGLGNYGRQNGHAHRIDQRYSLHGDLLSIQRPVSGELAATSLSVNSLNGLSLTQGHYSRYVNGDLPLIGRPQNGIASESSSANSSTNAVFHAVGTPPGDRDVDERSSSNNSSGSEQRVSVISSGSSNTTSGIVSDLKAASLEDNSDLSLLSTPVAAQTAPNGHLGHNGHHMTSVQPQQHFALVHHTNSVCDDYLNSIMNSKYSLNGVNGVNGVNNNVERVELRPLQALNGLNGLTVGGGLLRSQCCERLSEPNIALTTNQASAKSANLALMHPNLSYQSVFAQLGGNVNNGVQLTQLKPKFLMPQRRLPERSESMNHIYENVPYISQYRRLPLFHPANPMRTALSELTANSLTNCHSSSNLAPSGPYGRLQNGAALPNGVHQAVTAASVDCLVPNLALKAIPTTTATTNGGCCNDYYCQKSNSLIWSTNFNLNADNRGRLLHDISS